ncbi:MAG TPA: DUF3987 domain-containing protein [Coleofasciculaceae cyanobacterium]|jgi:DNA primase catalytic core
MVATPISSTPQRQQEQEALSRCLEDAINTLSAEQIYNHPSHNFKHSGDRLRGRCPLHQSNSGSSFVVTISSKLFWCEGCQFGGGSADYRASLKAGRWVKVRGKDFVETVRELAVDANVRFPARESSPEEIAKAQKWERRRAVLAETQNYCQEILWSDRVEALEARHYLVAERGLTEEEIKRLPIGYYPNAGEVKRHLISKGFTKEDWEGTGCYWKDMERYITFLWNDASGRPLTIYGRYFKQHPPEGKPKTIASPGERTKQSPLYFDRALKAGHNEVVLVEGVLDTVLLQAKGDTRVCAYVAASCSSDQIEILKRRGITKATLCGDPDHGGERGTNSNLLRLSEAGISVYVAPKLPDGLDPDEFLIREGIKAWDAHIDAASHGFRWKAQRLTEAGDTSTDKGKAEVLRSAIAFCKAVKNHPELDIFFWPVIRSSLGMEPEEFRAQLERLWESSPVEVADLGGGSGGSGGDDGDGRQPLAELSLRDRILEILDRNQEPSHRDEAFIKLAQTTGVTTREIKDLAASLESEVDLGESRCDRKTEIENLLRVSKYQLELQDYLDPSVALPLEQVAKWMGTTSAAMLTTLYPVVGSLLKVGTRLELIKATDHYALPVVYTGLVCESGAGKTPAQKTILKPLFALQDEAEVEYKERLLDYQQELSEWKKNKDKNKDSDEPAPEQPVPREYYTTDATSEAIALIQNQQPNEGFLGWFDELPALFKSQGQYKNGRGADGEKILSGRDGTGFKVNRASGKRLVVNQSAYSITGSLQPLILRQMMGDFTDANGQWARFLWTVMQVQPAPYPHDAIPFDVSGLLKGIYKRLRNLPPITYTLSSQAKKLYSNWYDELDRLKMAESRQGIRAVYSKMKGDTGVLALLLHCFNGCVAEGSTPALEIDEATMAAAIKLSKYHIGQVRLIHSEGDVANGDVAAIHAKIIQLSERKGWLKAADVRDIDRQTKKQFSADDIRRHFQELEASGFGQTRGQRTKLTWSIHKDPPPDGNPPHSDQTQDSFEQLRTNSGQKSPNSGQTQDSLKMAESITDISVQQLVIQTQDTQDSFLASAAPSPNPLSPKNELKAADLIFDDLSCPEFEDKAQTQLTVGISEETKTQDSCPESVLSCPEFGANSDEDTLSEKVAQPEVDETQPNTSLPIYQRSDSGFEVLQNQSSLVFNIQCDKSDSEDDEMLPEDIREIAADLANEEACSSKEVLAELRKCWSNEAINAACQSLPIERRSQIEHWLSELI